MGPLQILKLIRISLLAIIAILPTVPASEYYPPHWLQICNQLSPQAERAHSPALVDLQCFILKSQRIGWKLYDLRAWTMDKNINHMTTPTNRTVIYDITVTCEPGAAISLSWPMRVKGLRELHVISCYILDWFIDINDTIDSSIGDDMKILEIRHSTKVYTASNVKVLLKSLNLTSDFHCGQHSSLETYISSNVSFTFDRHYEPEMTTQAQRDNFVDDQTTTPAASTTNSSASNGPAKPEDRLIKDTTKVISDNTNLQTEEHDGVTKPVEAGKQAGDVQSTNSRFAEKTTKSTIEERSDKNNKSREIELIIVQLYRLFGLSDVHCSYNKLKVQDESIAQFTSVRNDKTLTQSSSYPVLEHINRSFSGLKEISTELSGWRNHYPKLKFLDLTHNQVSQVKVFNDRPTAGVGVVTFDLRFNNITSINMDVLKSWASVDDFFVDVRDNPINCECDMTSLLSHLVSVSTFQGRLEPYEYVKYLKCHLPEDLRGRELYTLTDDSLHCPSHKSYTTAIIILCIILALIIIITIIIIKFKAEIRILLYTRFHVRLPCDTDVHENRKTFDAFVSYSNHDYVWVCENLVQILENPANENSFETNRTSNHSNSSGAAISQKCLRLCIHQRDFVPGKTIFDNIVDCIQASRHTIIVLSPSFMKSPWSIEELRQAYRQSLVEKTRHLIIILLKKVSHEEMDPLVRRCCKTFTYLDANESLFKDRLLFSLATKSRPSQPRNRSDAKKNNVPKVPSDAPVYDTIGDTPVNVYDKTGPSYSHIYKTGPTTAHAFHKTGPTPAHAFHETGVSNSNVYVKTGFTHAFDKTGSNYSHFDKTGSNQAHAFDKTGSNYSHVFDKTGSNQAHVFDKTGSNQAHVFDKTGSTHANVYDTIGPIHTYDNMAHFGNSIMSRSQHHGTSPSSSSTKY